MQAMYLPDLYGGKVLLAAFECNVSCAYFYDHVPVLDRPGWAFTVSDL